MVPTVLAATLLALIQTVFSHRVPVIDGIMGGVPALASRTAKFKAAVSTTPTDPVAGSLRVVENSGICGNWPM